MKKEEYMEIGEKFWKMDTAIINFCGMPEDIHPPIKGYIIKGLCLGLTKYNEHIRASLFKQYLKDFPKDKNNRFQKVGGQCSKEMDCKIRPRQAAALLGFFILY